jgi:predicted O-methyltransferase YrrM
VLGVLPELLERIYAEGTVEDAAGEPVAAFPASLPRRHAEELVRLVRDEGARRTLETGMAFGVSTVAIASVHADGRHVAIDPNQHGAFRGIGMLNAERAGVASRVELIEEASELALPRLAASRAGEPLDLVLIDGLHLFDHTLVDFFYADRLLRVGGVVVFHDTWMPAVRQTASFVLANRAYERLEAGDEEMWALRKTAADDRAWDFHRDFLPQPTGLLPRLLSSARARATRG